MKTIFSMKMAVLILFLFGVIAGVATFIENDYGTQTAQALVYKTKWFEVFLAYFAAILAYNIVKFKSYKTRFPVFLFHLSFLIIAMGALITRYVGYEGVMHIREGKSSHTMVSDYKSLQVEAKSGEQKTYGEEPLYLSSMTSNHVNLALPIGEKSVEVRLLKYLPTAQEKAIADPTGKKILELKIATGAKGQIYYFAKGQKIDFGGFYLAYEAEPSKTKPTFLIHDSGEGFKVAFPFKLTTVNMNDRSSGALEKGENDFSRRMLYQFGDNSIVLKEVHAKARVDMVAKDLKTQSGKAEYIEWEVAVGELKKRVVTRPYKGDSGEIHRLSLDGIDIQLRVGAKQIELPFAIKLLDFQLERYPGSMTPASYASEVVLLDKEQGIEQPYRIYMNHILNHRNYRFFQSSYDQDEKGTVLSVNHDPGTLPTYIGYLLLVIGMIWSLFISKGRFQKLLKGARKLQQTTAVVAVLAIGMFAPQMTQAASPVIAASALQQMQAYSMEHAEKFGMLPVQDYQGRMKPMDTVAHEVISKVTGKSSLFGLEPIQMLLGMVMEPSLYQSIPMIKIGHPKIAVNLGLPEESKFAKFSDFFTQGKDGYKLYQEITDASRKKPLEQSKYDKELIKIDERVNVAYMAYQASLLKLYPIPNDTSNKWLAPMEAFKVLPKKEADLVKLSISAYFKMVGEGVKTGNWENADIALKGIRIYQKKYGAAVMPSEDRMGMEIQYNKLGLFGKLVPLYLLLGLILLIFAFINVVKPAFSLKMIMRVAWGILLLGFVIHVTGLGIRWYIADHAPWSNAYESIVFIAGSTVLAGIILAKNSPFALAGTALLAGITMGVAHMNFINPEITNLVPVLKSYWLMIHVATIIAGDGFLGLGSILSLLVLTLYIMRGKNGNANIDRSIKELSNLSEMGLIIGLMLMTVGNFLGGVWANESWGRYWGWDPKETWAAVTILIYATVLHLRFIPALKSNFTYNVAATWAYSTVLMTYFGVNYYLPGLHSYAAGDPVPIPMWVYYAIAGLFVLTMLAARNRKLK